MKKRVTGIGGIFFKVKDPETTKSWYQKHLGLNVDRYGTAFEWRSSENPEKKGFSQWSSMDQKKDYFKPSEKDFMFNYRVENLEQLVKELKAEGVVILDQIATFEYGKFVHILDKDDTALSCGSQMIRNMIASPRVGLNLNMNSQTSPRKIKLSLAWSGGKDSAFALWKLQIDCRYEVSRLHTTFGEETRRVGLHGIHEDLIEAQAESIGLPLDKIFYPASGDNTAYEKAMGDYLDFLEKKGINHLAFGDIFLEDLRKYREENLAERGFQAIFPLWKIDTKILANEFIEKGFKTKICAANAHLIAKNQVGVDFSSEFLKVLPDEIDPCGENGEFHSFCYAGPIFKHPVEIKVGEIISKAYDIPLADGSVDKKHYWFAAIHLANS